MPRLVAAAIALALATLAFTAPAQAAGLQIADAKCIPAEHCQVGKPRYVAPGGKLALKGSGLKRGHLVLFPRKTNKKKLITSKLRRSRSGLIVVVPPAAGSGRIRVMDSRGRK